MRWLGLVVLAIVAVIAAVFLWLRSVPAPGGTILAHGLSAPVTVERDRFGIPTITAANERDAAFAVGYLHASERLFQMDLMRHIGAGRISEWSGGATLGIDRFTRTLGIYGTAEAQYQALPPDGRAVLDAYADGVNDWIEHRTTALPPEYYLLGVRPEPWRPADSLVWGKLMSLQLAGNFRNELFRARLLQHLKPEDLDVLYPPYPKDAPVPTGDTAALLKAMPLDAIYAALPDLVGPIYASNNWVVDGKHTVSGKPMLANDPHLGLDAPGIWYLAHIITPDMDVAGVTAPSVPYVVLGHNARIAWGFTTTTGDVEDCFIEKIDPNDPNKYLTPDGSAPFATRAEKILVRRGEPVTITVRTTRHGPVISDLGEDYAKPAPQGTVLALQATWLAIDDRSPEALRGIDRAQNWDQFRDALKLFAAPEQNMVYADIDGNIGFIAPARIPIRAKGDGFIPSPGWSGDYDWKGFIPFDELPMAYNPASGRIVTANNKIVPDSYPYFISREWDYPNRAERIAQLLAAKDKFAPDDFAAIQADTLSLMAKDLIPLMTQFSPAAARDQGAIDRLKDWDFHMGRDQVEPLIFVAWLRELTRELFEPKLGKELNRFWSPPHPLVVRSILTEHRDWCVAEGGAAGDCPALLALSLHRALDDLAKRYGDDMATWHWGRAHRARFINQFWSKVPVVGGWFAFDLPTDGGSDTVNRGEMSYANDEPFADDHGPGLRTIVDLAAPERARFLIAPGQSASPLSPHYADLATRWRDFAWLEFGASPAEPTIHLVPAP